MAPSATTPAPSMNQPLRWKARWRDEFLGGVYDMRARWWAPEIAAFLEVDQLEYHDARSTLFGWPHQNPMRWSDPSGRNPVAIAIGIAVVAYFGLTTQTDITDAPPVPQENLAVAGLITLPISGMLAPGATPAMGLGGFAMMTPVEQAGGAGLVTNAVVKVAEQCPAIVRTGDAVGQGLVRSGGNLERVLRAIEQQHALLNPKNELDALEALNRATSSVGLGSGVGGGLTPSGAIVLQNVGGVTTTLGANGSILVQQGGNTLLKLGN